MIKFLFPNNHSTTKIRQILLKTSGKKIISESTVRKWRKRFQNRDRSVEEHQGDNQISRYERRGRMVAIQGDFYESKNWSFSALSAETGISHIMCCRIVTWILKTRKQDRWYGNLKCATWSLDDNVKSHRYFLVIPLDWKKKACKLSQSRSV